MPAMTACSARCFLRLLPWPSVLRLLRTFQLLHGAVFFLRSLWCAPVPSSLTLIFLPPTGSTRLLLVFGFLAAFHLYPPWCAATSLPSASCLIKNLRSEQFLFSSFSFFRSRVGVVILVNMIIILDLLSVSSVIISKL